MQPVYRFGGLVETSSGDCWQLHRHVRDVLVQPGRAFSREESRSKWLPPLALMALAVMSYSMSTVLLTPPDAELASLIDPLSSLGVTLRVTAGVLTGLVSFGSWLIWLLAIYVSLRTLRVPVALRETVSVLGWAALPNVVKTLCLMCLSLLAGRAVSGVSAADLSATTGALHQMLQMVEPFTIWNWLLSVLGMIVCLRVSPRVAVIAVTAPALLGVLAMSSIQVLTG